MPYIDFNASPGGDGSQGSPYDDLTELNAAAGDRGSEIWYIKRGGVIEDAGIVLNSTASNLTIQAYGSGDNPIIDASAVADDWVFVSGTSYSSVKASTGGIHRAAIVDEVKVPDYASQAAAEASGFGTYWTGTALYLSLGGIDPNTAAVRYTSQPNAFFHLQSSSTGGVHVQDLDFRWANGINAFLQGASTNSGFRGCRSYGGGGWGEDDGPGNCFTINSSSGDKGQSNYCVSCEGWEPHNNGFECQQQDGVIVESNEFHDCSTGIELWGFNEDCSIRYNRLYRIGKTLLSLIGDGNCVWLAQTNVSPPETGNNNNNIISYNLISQSGTLSVTDDCSGNIIANNTVDGGFDATTSGNLTLLGNGTNNQLINNIMILRDVGAPNYKFLGETGSTSDPSNIVQNNIFYRAFTPANLFNWSYNGSNYNSVASFDAAESNVSANLDSDPEFTDLAFYRILTASPAYRAGQSTSQTIDFYGKSLLNPPSIGAVEYDMTTVIVGREFTGQSLQDAFSGQQLALNDMFSSKAKVTGGASSGIPLAFFTAPASGATTLGGWTFKCNSAAGTSQTDLALYEWDSGTETAGALVYESVEQNVTVPLGDDVTWFDLAFTFPSTVLTPGQEYMVFAQAYVAAVRGASQSGTFESGQAVQYETSGGNYPDPANAINPVILSPQWSIFLWGEMVTTAGDKPSLSTPYTNQINFLGDSIASIDLTTAWIGATSYEVIGLPSSLSASGGVVSGDLTITGNFSVLVRATNEFGTSEAGFNWFVSAVLSGREGGERREIILASESRIINCPGGSQVSVTFPPGGTPGVGTVDQYQHIPADGLLPATRGGFVQSFDPAANANAGESLHTTCDYSEFVNTNAEPVLVVVKPEIHLDRGA